LQLFACFVMIGSCKRLETPPDLPLASRQAWGMPLAPFAMSSFNLAVKFQREARMTE
jgi:hypothetical protein